jgi:hypothetical protein
MLDPAEVFAMSGLTREQAESLGLPPVDPRLSLMITDESVTARFTFEEFMARLASQSPIPLTAQTLFDQWMDTNNAAPGLGLGAHCNDTVDEAGVATKNGFAVQCPRAEGRQVGASVFDPASPDSYVAIALVNRFDLASLPAQGNDCGEYRIVFAKRSGMTDRLNRNLVVFEGVLPNPGHNGRDLSGCLPVVRFWNELSGIADTAERADRLHSFFYQGLPGFAPVVRAAAYGNASTRAKGQVRTNQFMQRNWLLRQYSLQVEGGVLRFRPDPAKGNPEGLLFNETIDHPKGAGFREAFLDAVASLRVNDVNRFNMDSLAETFKAFDSDAEDPLKTNYTNQFANSPGFAASIQTRLTPTDGEPVLTPADIVARAQAMSCAGCHQLSNNRNVGGGITWPASLGFVHIAEDQTEPVPGAGADVRRFLISPALRDVYLPHRQRVMDAFVGRTP